MRIGFLVGPVAVHAFGHPQDGPRGQLVQLVVEQRALLQQLARRLELLSNLVYNRLGRTL